MCRPRMHNAMTRLLLAATLATFLVPLVHADSTGLGRTTDGGCYLIDWSSNPYVISPAAGCTAETSCVDINWTTTPPEVAIVDC